MQRGYLHTSKSDGHHVSLGDVQRHLEANFRVGK
jgi:hypothetical protein